MLDYGCSYTKISLEEFMEIHAKSEQRLEYIAGEIKEDFKEPDLLRLDLLVICDLLEKMEDRFYRGVPPLVVKILSSSTRSLDMIDKLRTYMLTDIPENWIVDPENEEVTVYIFVRQEIKEVRTYRTREYFISNGIASLQSILTILLRV